MEVGGSSLARRSDPSHSRTLPDCSDLDCRANRPERQSRLHAAQRNRCQRDAITTRAQAEREIESPTGSKKGGRRAKQPTSPEKRRRRQRPPAPSACLAPAREPDRPGTLRDRAARRRWAKARLAAVHHRPPRRDDGNGRVGRDASAELNQPGNEPCCSRSRCQPSTATDGLHAHPPPVRCTMPEWQGRKFVGGNA